MKRFLSGIVLLLTITLGMSLSVKADMGMPDGVEYDAFIINPDGIVCDEVEIPYGAQIRVIWDSINSDGRKTADFEYEGDYHSTDADNILPVELDLKDFPLLATPREVFAYAETALYEGPAFAYAEKARVPAGTKLTVTREGGEYFVYAECAECEGWVLCANYCGTATIMEETDYKLYVAVQKKEIETAEGNGTGVFIKPGEAVHVIAQTPGWHYTRDRRFKIEYNDTVGYMRDSMLYEEPEKHVRIHITSPSHISSYELFRFDKEMDYECDYDKEVGAIRADYAHDSAIYRPDDNDKVFIYEDWGDYILGTDKGFVVFYDDGENQAETLKADRNIECYEDFFLNEEIRSIISKGTEFTVIYTCDYDDVTHCYIEGYGWVSETTVDNVRNGIFTDENGKKEKTEEGPKPQPAPSPAPVENTTVDAKTEMNKNLTIVLAGAILLAGAATAGIVLLCKKNKKKETTD